MTESFSDFTQNTARSVDEKLPEPNPEPPRSVPPVSPVDVDDLKAVTRVLEDFGRTGRLEIDALEKACKKRAFVPMVIYRAAMLNMLELVAPELVQRKDGQLSDAVFRVAAEIPMPWEDTWTAGVPFDKEEFRRRLANDIAGIPQNGLFPEKEAPAMKHITNVPDALTELYLGRYMAGSPFLKGGAMITNRKDAVAELMRDRYLYAHPDGTFVNPDRVAFSKEAFEELKSEGSIVLIAEYEKTKIAVYKYVEDTGLEGSASHYHEHD